MKANGQGPVAAIDCGTNSTRLLVVDQRGRTLMRTMHITRLGEGVDATHSLAPAAVKRTITVLEEMHEQMVALGVVAARLVATSAARDARNRDEFLEAASLAAGVPAEILSGEEEGLLAFAGATTELDPVAGDDVVVDIGGGSTELIVGRAGHVAPASLDIGCVRLSERHLAHDPPLAGELAAAAADVDAAVDRAVGKLLHGASLPPGSRLIGLAGTVSTLAALEQHLGEYDRARIHHFVLSGHVVASWLDTLAAEDAAARSARPGMDRGREDVIVGGVLILREVMLRLGMTACLVSESDLLDGMAAALLGAS